MSTMKVSVERVQDVLDDEGSATGEFRVLVDRLWPRGIKKERLDHDAWNKDVAPSSDLRKAFHSGELGFSTFSEHYKRELQDSDAPEDLLNQARSRHARNVVLLFAAKDTEHNHAQVLQEVLQDLAD